MREMGAGELPTREGEIEIAKRIEGGLKDMIQAISACPTTIAEIIAASEKIANDETKIDEIVDGLVDMDTSAQSQSSAASSASSDLDDAAEEEADEEEDEEEIGRAPRRERVCSYV